MDVAPRTLLINLGVFALLVLSVFIVNIDALSSAPTTWCVTAVITALVGVAAIDFAWWINVRLGRPLTVAQAALEALSVGLVFGVTQVVVAAGLGLHLMRGVVLTVTSVTISAGAFGVLVILIGQARSAEVARIQGLYEEGELLESARQETSGIIRGLYVALASDIDAALSPARIAIETRLADQERLVASDTWSDVAGELRMAASATVRPLSRQLWAYAPTRMPMPGLGRILRTIITEQPFQPLVLILIYWAATFGGSVATLGWINGLIALTIGTVLIAALLGGANAVMRRYPTHHAVIFIVAALALQATGLLTFALRDAWGAAPFTWAEYVLSCIGGIVLILVTSGFGSIRTHRSNLARTFRADIDDELRASMVSSAQVAQLARESAQVLHGSVQTRLVACAVAIERASQTSDVDAFRTAMHEAHAALVPPTLGFDDTRRLGEQLERTVSLWSGLCSVHLAIDPSLVGECGVLARNIARVVEEAVNNAVSHGDATEIDVDVRGAGNSLLIEVTDNGSGFSDDTPGLGSALLDSLCGRWELTNAPQGTVLSATLLRP